MPRSDEADVSRGNELRAELAAVDAESAMLDEMIAAVGTELHEMLTNLEVSKYAYINQVELPKMAVAADKMVIAVECPVDTVVSVTPGLAIGACARAAAPKLESFAVLPNTKVPEC